MSHEETRVGEIQKAILAVSSALAELERAGAGVPAVERNAVRLKGTLRPLEVQFLLLGDG